LVLALCTYSPHTIDQAELGRAFGREAIKACFLSNLIAACCFRTALLSFSAVVKTFLALDLYFLVAGDFRLPLLAVFFLVDFSTAFLATASTSVAIAVAYVLVNVAEMSWKLPRP
jgi:hypothetical protein